MDWRLLAALGACCVAGLFACTEPAERTRVTVRVQIDAEYAVRDLVDEAQVLVEKQQVNSGGWQVETSQRFEPRVLRKWPLELTLDPESGRYNYQVTATARDEREAVLAEARALRDWDDLDGRSILLRFEAACLRRTELCPKGETCHAGECVDAHYEAPRETPPPSTPDPMLDAGPDPGGPTLGTEGEACEIAGARACTQEGSRTPLECADGKWRPAMMCGEDELCDTALGAQRGTCRAMAKECIGQTPNVPFCDRETMRVCVSAFAAETRVCGLNERCVATTEARCECRPGFVRGDTGCERPTDCKVDNGGCDVLTTCTMRGTTRECGPCPAGYVGQGDTGCEPLLAGLTPASGELVPAFDPTVHSYRLKVPLLTQRVALTPSAPSAERIVMNGATVASDQGWTTPTLPLGEYPVQLTLTSKSGASSDYEVIIERGGSQTAYLKASNTNGGDNFGVGLAISGDTIVVGAFLEDSAAKTVGGDQANNSASEAGAAYVFVDRAGKWEQQAYLKGSESAAGDHFGARVAIEGDTIVVGAIMSPLDWNLSRATDRPGAAYVFTRSAGQWTQTARLVSPDKTSDRFGHGVAIHGDTIAVGAPSDGGDGSVFVFTRAGNDWAFQAKLKAMSGAAGSAFGYNLALWKDTLLVSAPLDNRPVQGGGSAYIFVRNGTTWQQQQRLVPDPPSSDATYGFGLALRGNRALVGAPRLASLINPIVTTEPGEVFAYTLSGGTWTQTQMLRGILPRVNDGFGSSVALNDTGALIGACNDASGARGVGADASRRDAGYAGSATLFALDNDKWKVSTYLKASNAAALDSFGYAVALSADTAVVSANWEASKATGVNGNGDDDSADQAGAAYVFK